ncbi:MAG: thioredoxin [Ruminococcaceae bacterium]|nr:thioredoxin [Oscillospiraceae bacterium]
MSAIKLNKSALDSLKRGEKTILLDFFADWCGPCRMVSPVIDEIARERDDVAVGKINVDSEPSLAREYGVYSIPTLVVIREGKVVGQAVGARSKEQILAMLNA